MCQTLYVIKSSTMKMHKEKKTLLEFLHSFPWPHHHEPWSWYCHGNLTELPGSCLFQVCDLEHSQIEHIFPLWLQLASLHWAIKGDPTNSKNTKCEVDFPGSDVSSVTQCLCDLELRFRELCCLAGPQLFICETKLFNGPRAVVTTSSDSVRAIIIFNYRPLSLEYPRESLNGFAYIHYTKNTNSLLV